MTETLKDLRKKNGKTLQDMAILLGLKTASAYYKKETGAVPLTLDEAKVISKFFKKPVDQIFL